MSLGKRIFLLALGPFLVSSTILLVLTYTIVSSQFNVIMDVIKKSMKDMESQAVESNQKNIEKQFNEIISHIGNRLQPGEDVRFTSLAEGQKKDKKLLEFSFYDLSKKVKLAADSNKEGKDIPAGIWQDLKNGQVVNKEIDNGLYIYKPLFADIDLVRFHPGWTKGQFFGAVCIGFDQQIIKEQLRAEEERISGTVKAGQKAFNHAMDVIKWTTLVVILFCVGLVFLIWITVQRITVAMSKLLKEAEVISSGDLSQHLEIDRKDEIGKLASTFNSMSDNLSEKAEVAGLIANGDLTSQVSLLSESDIFGKAFQLMIKNLSNSMSQFLNMSNRVSEGAIQLVTASDSLAQGATSQAASVEEISSTIAEVSSQAKGNSQHASEANKLTQTVSKEAENGSKNVIDMTDAMERISDASKKISQIIKTIDDIAFQTNILALNAAVEAARAGVHGKGFAVVADEVRTLAGRSATAASETASLIEDAIKRVNDGQLVVTRTTESFREIVTGIEKISTITQEIATASEEQAMGVGQVDIGLQQISSVSQQNTANAEETASAARDMSGYAKQVQEIVATFKLKDDGQHSNVQETGSPRMLT